MRVISMTALAAALVLVGCNQPADEADQPVHLFMVGYATGLVEGVLMENEPVISAGPLTGLPLEECEQMAADMNATLTEQAQDVTFVVVAQCEYRAQRPVLQDPVDLVTGEPW